MINAVILALVGLFISAVGIAVWYGRTELLTHYSNKNGPKALANQAGGLLTVYGVLTLGTAVIVAQTEESMILWGGWIALSVFVGFAVASIATTYE